MVNGISSSQLEQESHTSDYELCPQHIRQALVEAEPGEESQPACLNPHEVQNGEEETGILNAESSEPVYMSLEELREIEGILDENKNLRDQLADWERSSQEATDQLQRLTELVKDQESLMEEKSN